MTHRRFLRRTLGCCAAVLCIAGAPYARAANPLVARAAGPYTVVAGSSVVLDPTTSYVTDGQDVITSTAWDINDDGVFDYTTTGVAPVQVPWSALQNLPYPNVANPIVLRIFDAHGNSSTNGTTLTITPSPSPAMGGAFWALAFASLSGVGFAMLRKPRVAAARS